MRLTLHSLTLALVALLLIPLASCGKDKPTPPDPQPAKREDIIGKVRTITMKMLDDKGEVTQRVLFTYNKQLQQTASILEDYVDGKFVLNTEEEYTYDASGHLILQKALSYERNSEGTPKPSSKVRTATPMTSRGVSDSTSLNNPTGSGLPALPTTMTLTIGRRVPISICTIPFKAGWSITIPTATREG